MHFDEILVHFNVKILLITNKNSLTMLLTSKHGIYLLL